MERTRLIAAAPVRSASEAWQVLSTLIADTLEQSSCISVGSVAIALSPLKGIGPALIAGGHLESKGLVLADKGLHVTIRVLTGDAALEIEENLNPVPSGAGATHNWNLHLPSAGPMDAAIRAAVKNSKHLSTKEPPEVKAEKSETSQPVIDVSALRSLGDKR